MVCQNEIDALRKLNDKKKEVLPMEEENFKMVYGPDLDRLISEKIDKYVQKTDSRIDELEKKVRYEDEIDFEGRKFERLYKRRLDHE